MIIYTIITTILSVLFLIVASSSIVRSWKLNKHRKAFQKQDIQEKKLKKSGLKPFKFFPNNKPVTVWGKNYKEASYQYNVNKKGGMYV